MAIAPLVWARTLQMFVYSWVNGSCASIFLTLLTLMCTVNYVNPRGIKCKIF